MGESAPDSKTPHYFLIRTFLGENDLLIIFNTKRCRYHCDFCQLPDKSSKVFIPGQDILQQFQTVLFESKHALSILDRITLSNEGSVFDNNTFSVNTLTEIIESINELRRVKTVVLETRLEFVEEKTLSDLTRKLSRAKINLLTGFETYDKRIRDEILNKREPISTFLIGLDTIAKTKSQLTVYVLYKPDPFMTDMDAYNEASRSIDFVSNECHQREIPFSVRLNPMYLAKGSKLASLARTNPNYLPPLLTDIMKLAEEKAKLGVKSYIGLSTEGLDEPSSNYTYREGYSSSLVKQVKLFNDQKIFSFDWSTI